MHKLLSRQLRRLTLENDIPEGWKSFLNIISQTYEEYEETIKNMDLRLEISSQELLERNKEINNALEAFKKSQSELIQAEKMAGLGKLIAGVGHEINTPAGAITNAIEEIHQDYAELLSDLVHIIDELSPDLRQTYLDACLKVISFQKDLSTAENRQIAHEIDQKLSVDGITSHSTMTKNLAYAGYNKDNIESLYDLLKSPSANLVQKSLFKLSMSQIHVRDIKIAISRIVNLVKALKLYSHDNPDQLMTTDLREDMNNTLIILHNRLKRAIKVYKEFDEISTIQCYADQLNQVWTNLINNAIEAMHGEGSIWIKIFHNTPDSITIQIKDNGPGIPADILPHIFETYYTTKPKGEGTGLGLSISQTIIAKHKGSIDVESKPGETIFTVVLPLNIRGSE